MEIKISIELRKTIRALGPAWLVFVEEIPLHSMLSPRLFTSELQHYEP